jgi:2-polyprenyl-3-methyl-5-hydroxy-6-metoxy-1,4-benzoquinol methylase
MSNIEHIPVPNEFKTNKNIPNIQTETVDICPVCGTNKFETYAYGYDYEIQTCSNEWRFVKCTSCAHIWLNPRPAIKELATIYPSTYYAYNYEENINPIAVFGKNILDNLKFSNILSYCKKNVRTFCDVGCGTGRFLRLMEKKGVTKVNNYGLELEEDSIKKIKEDGFQVYAERVEDCSKIPLGSLDLVTMFHVIEHVDNPGVVIDKIVSWLSEDGIFAIETPNINSKDAIKYKKTYWGGYHFPRHWNLFSEKTMIKLLEDRGLEVIAVKYQTGHSFWMYSNHHQTRYDKGNIQASKKYDPMKGLPLLIMFTLYDKIRILLGAKTSAMLLIAKKK